MNHNPTPRGSLLRVTLMMLISMMISTVAGCALKPKHMVPAMPAQNGLGTGKSLRIAEVSGGLKPKFGGPELINDKEFREALMLTLTQSGLFTEVSSDKGELNLYAAIRSQDQKVSRGLQYTATMVVSYRIMDQADNLLWSESYESEFSSVAISGATRTMDAREGSARENLSLLVQGIQKHWSQ